MESSAPAMLNEIDSNKESSPPKEEKTTTTTKTKKKNPIPIVAPSFKKKGNRKTSKRVPLADITYLFQNSAPSANEEDGGSSAVPPPSSESDSVVLNSNPRRRTTVVAPGSKSKTLWQGFR